MKHTNGKRSGKTLGFLAFVSAAALLAGGVRAALSLTARNYATPGAKSPNSLVKLRGWY